MSEVFISYSREDQRQARRIAKRLERLGFKVWWDRKIPAGVPFDEFIQKKLDGSKCVVVLWSKVSIESEFVKDEASRGASRDVLIPALVEEVPLPLGFGRLQTANLVDWDGDPEAANFVRFTNSMARMMEREDLVRRVPEEESSISQAMVRDVNEYLQENYDTLEPTPAGEPERSKPPARRSPLVLLLTVALVAALGVAGYLYYGSRSQAPPEEPAPVDPGPVEPPPEKPEPVEPVAVEPEPEPVEPSPEEPATPEPVPDSPTPTGPDPAEIERAQRRARAQALFQGVSQRESDPAIGAEELLEEYEQLWNEHVAELEAAQAATVAQRMDELKRAIQRFEEVRGEEGGRHLTLEGKIGLWREFQPARPSGPQAAFAAERLSELEGVAERLATVASPDDFVTCGGVVRENDRVVGPRGVRDEFRRGDVYVFAWIQSPGSEELRLEWGRADGSTIKTSRPRVQRNLARGYRIYYSKGFQEAGEYEVRLFNSAGHLIALRPFRVTG